MFLAFLASAHSIFCRIGSNSQPLLPDFTSSRVISDFTSDDTNRTPTHDELFDRRLRAKREHANPYRFRELESLSGLQDEDRAKELLQLLSTDPGVLAVLKKHKWTVGKLCEMYPEVIQRSAFIR